MWYVLVPGVLCTVLVVLGIRTAFDFFLPTRVGRALRSEDTELDELVVALAERRFAVLGFLHTGTLFFLLRTAAGWPDSALYWYALVTMAVLHSGIYVLWWLGHMPRLWASCLFVGVHACYVIIAASLTGPRAEEVLLWMHDCVGATLMSATMNGGPFGVAFLFIMSLASVALNRLGPLLEIRMCTSCLWDESRYLPVAASAFVLVQYYLLSIDSRDKHALLTRKFASLDATKNRFISSVAHEVRTPLNGILGTCELLSPQEQEMESFQVVSHCSQVLALLLENVLVAGSTAEPKLTIVDTNVPQLASHLSTVLKGLCFKAQASREPPLAASVQVKVTVDESVPDCIQIAKSSLMQVCLNLGSNACKFSSPASGDAVHVHFWCIGRILTVRVTDSGPGIPADFVDRLFVPYQRLSRDRVIAGTGLGLAITKRLCEAMGGSVLYAPRSAPHRGSVFTATVPFQAVDRCLVPTPPKILFGTSTEEETTEDDEEQLERLGRKRRADLEVLLVEDGQVNQIVAMRMLTRLRPDVHVAVVEEGASALEYLLTRTKGGQQSATRLLVLMDINMPVLNGRKASMLWRELEKALGVKVPAYIVAVSASHAGEVGEGSFDAVLPKPVRLNKLEEIMDAASRV